MAGEGAGGVFAAKPRLGGLTSRLYNFRNPSIQPIFSSFPLWQSAHVLFLMGCSEPVRLPLLPYTAVVVTALGNWQSQPPHVDRKGKPATKVLQVATAIWP